MFQPNLHETLTGGVPLEDPTLETPEEDTTLSELESITLIPLGNSGIDTTMYTQLDTLYSANSLYSQMYMPMMTPVVMPPITTTPYTPYVTSTVTSVTSSLLSGLMTTSATTTADHIANAKKLKRSRSATVDSDSEPLLIPKKQPVKRRSRSRKSKCKHQAINN